MFRAACITGLVLLTLFNRAPAQEPAAPQRQFIAGGLAHSPGRWLVVSGKVRVLNGYTIVFGDGTEVALENGPELEQQGKIGDAFYPAGREAAEFLKQLIGDRAVTMYVNADTDEYRRGDRTTGLCYVEDSNLGYELIANGWALADHSLMVPAELIARLNQRGLWRGEFVRPDRWRAGERLPGEVAAVQDELPAKQAAAPAATVHERVPGSINHGGGDAVWRRVTGRVNVLDARTLEFSDGTRIELDLTIPHPDQMAGLASLQKLPRLTRLVLPYRSTDAALESISGISTLESLALHFAEATDAGLIHVKKLQDLRRLCLHGATITDAGLAPLQELPRLAVLEFGRIPISDAGAPHLAACANLEYLDVSDTEITDAGAVPLAGLTRLRVLRLPERVTPEVRNRLQQALPALRFEGSPEEVESPSGSN